MASARCLKISSVILLIVSFTLIGGGIWGLVGAPDFLQDQVINQLPLTADSDQLDSWSTPPVPIYLQFWLWECVNVADFELGTKPMLVERGPFTYLEHRQKVGIAFNDNRTVTYRQKIAYTFIRNMSVADETEVIRMINIPLVTVFNMLQNLSALPQEIIEDLLRLAFNETLFVYHTAREWLWGYEDPFLKVIHTFAPDIIADPNFGFFYGQNETDDGLYTVYTGRGNIDLINTINKWNGESYLRFWKTPYGNMINGTDGSWVQPLYGKELADLRVYLYSTQICRSVYAKFEEESSVLDISTRQFSIPAEVFDNATLNPDNAAFGTYDSGILDVSVCNQGAPIIISLPHLLYAADTYREGVDGINPNPNYHRTVLQIEPHTGLVISAQKRLQINVNVTRMNNIEQLKNIHSVILPAMWINESTTIDQKSADDLGSQVLNFFSIIKWVSVGVIILGAVCIVISVTMYRRAISKLKNDDEIRINNDE